MVNSTKKIWAEINDKRIYIIFLVVYTFLALTAPKFFNVYNTATILGTSMLNGIVIIGFTVVLICGHLDLSTVAIINAAGNIAIYVTGKTNNFVLAILAAVLAGIVVGAINGALITKAKINSFIATLGMSTLLQGLVSYSNNAATRSISNFGMTDFLDIKLLPILSNRALITIIIVLLMHFFISSTVVGKNFYLVGGNVESAWYAGINTERYLIVAFAMNGAFAAIGGALYSLYLASAMADIGTMGISPLNMLIAASVLGGASLSGGKGSILKSFVGVVTLNTLYNGLSCFKLGYAMQVLVNGLVLIIVVLIEAISEYRKKKMQGSKSDLFKLKART